MDRTAIINYLNKLPYTMYGRKANYLKTEWYSFKPENLRLLQDIQANEVPWLFLDTTKSELRLKMKISL